MTTNEIRMGGIGSDSIGNETININMAEEEKQKMTMNQRVIDAITNNTTIMRSELLGLMDKDTHKKEIDFECGYPEVLTPAIYNKMYKRFGVATRAVDIYPEESWAVLPEVSDSDDADETAFEKEWKLLEKEKHVFEYLQRIDVLSGIGQFGVLLLGINDGKALNEPVDGIDEKTGKKVGNAKHELTYLKPFDESVVTIKKKENDSKSPRFGKPIFYDIIFEDNTSKDITTSTTKSVHWTRIIHIADNRGSSDVLGMPRMEKVYNILLDLKKVLGGSGEMFWKGGFPGLAFKIDPDQTLSTEQEEAMETEIRNYANSLQRYLTFIGIEVKSLETQVADPKGHLESQINALCAALAVPKRIFMGSERGELASSQDTKAWNKRITHRQVTYLTPLLIMPFIDRLVVFGVLPEPQEIKVTWHDLNTPSDDEIAGVAVKRTDALSKYVAGGVEGLISPKDFFTVVMGFTLEQAEAIETGLKGFVGSTAGKKEDDGDGEKGADKK